MIQPAGGWTRPVILNDELDRAIAIFDAQSDPPLGRCRFDGVPQQAPQGSANLPGVDIQAPVLWRLVTDEAHLLLPGDLLERVADLAHNDTRGHYLRVGKRWPGKAHQIGEHEVDPLSLPDDCLQWPDKL